MRPPEQIYEWILSDTTNSGGSHDSKNMADIVYSNLIHTILFLSGRALQPKVKGSIPREHIYWQ